MDEELVPPRFAEPDEQRKKTLEALQVDLPRVKALAGRYPRSWKSRRLTESQKLWRGAFCVLARGTSDEQGSSVRNPGKPEWEMSLHERHRCRPIRLLRSAVSARPTNSISLTCPKALPGKVKLR